MGKKIIISIQTNSNINAKYQQTHFSILMIIQNSAIKRLVDVFSASLLNLTYF